MKKPRLQAGVLLVLLILAGFGLREFLKGRTPLPQTENKHVARSTALIRAENPAVAAAPSANIVVSNTLFRTANTWWQQPIAEEAFARFHDWAERYAGAPPSDKATLESEGISLSKERRLALAALIAVLTLFFVIYLRIDLPQFVNDDEAVFLIGLCMVLGVGFIELCARFPAFSPYGVPIGAIAILVMLLLHIRLAFLISAVLSIFCGVLYNLSFNAVLVAFFSSMAAMLAARNVRHRSDMIRAGMSLPALMQLMGHADIQTTLRYVQVTPQDVYLQYARAVAQHIRPLPRTS